MLETEILQGFSRAEVMLTLNRIRTRCSKPPVGEATFYRWCSELGITPKFRYSDQEVKRLARICYHYATGGTTKTLPNI